MEDQTNIASTPEADPAPETSATRDGEVPAAASSLNLSEPQEQVKDAELKQSTSPSLQDELSDKIQLDAAPQRLQPTGNSPYEMDIQKKLIATFAVMMHNNKQVFNVRDVGIVLRQLGRYPRDADVRHLFDGIEENCIVKGESDDDVSTSLENILPVLTKVFMEDRFREPGKERLLSVFESLDDDKDGLIDADVLTDLLRGTGEPLSEEQIQQFEKTFRNRKTGKVDYLKYCKRIYEVGITRGIDDHDADLGTATT